MDDLEAKLRMLADHAASLMAYLDSDGFYRFVNRRYEDWFGLVPDQIVGKHYREIIGDSAYQRLKPRVDEALAGRYVAFEIPLRYRYGRPRWVAVTYLPEFNDMGDVAGFFAIVNDITQRKQAEVAFRESEDRFRNLVQDSSQGVFIDRYRKPLFANQAFADLLGYESPDEILALESLEPHIAPHDRARLSAYTEARLRGDPAPAEYEYDALRKDGTPIVVLNVVSLVNWEGQPATQGTAIDITERKRVEQELQRSEARFKDFAKAAADWFWETDEDMKLSFLSGRYRDVMGLELAQLLGHTLLELVGDETQRKPEDWREYREHLAARQPYMGLEFDWIRPDGGTRTLRASGTPFFDADNRFKGYRGAVSDVTEARRLTRLMAHQASHDALTGLANRREFTRRLENALDSAKEKGTPYALCYLDLDNFKLVNDTVGHVAGDELLKRVVELLQAKVRSRDTLGRLGGDEFGLLLENCELDKATDIAESLVSAVTEFGFVWDEHRFEIGVSIGLVAITAEAGSTVQLMSQADVACYAAKSRGRNRVHVYRREDRPDAERDQQMLQAAELRDALERDAFELHAQPVVPLNGHVGAPVVYEILVRLVDVEGALVLPGTFIPAAEKYGLMVGLDRWVLRNALREFSAKFKHTPDVGISVNLSGDSLNDASLADYVREQLEHYGIPGKRVCFEFSEDAAVKHLSRASRLIADLRASGCSFALDDFGSNLSSFTNLYLKQLPVDFLKVDSRFVQRMLEDPVARAMVTTINQVGHVMGARTIAEGVESEPVLEALQAMGIDFALGHVTGSPAPLEQIEVS